jgi:hypothetical protein
MLSTHGPRASQPLQDLSEGRLKAWPGGWIITGSITTYTFRPVYSGEAPEAVVYRCRGIGRWMYCKYCCKCVTPLALEEFKYGTRMTICPDCGAGLTPPKEIR